MELSKRVRIVQSDPIDFPPGTVPGPWRITLAGVGDLAYSREWINDTGQTDTVLLQPGTYLMRGARLDAFGKLLGDEVQEEVTLIDPTPVKISVASGIEMIDPT
jgi:hypothetical protein